MEKGLGRRERSRWEEVSRTARELSEDAWQRRRPGLFPEVRLLRGWLEPRRSLHEQLHTPRSAAETQKPVN